MALINTTTTGVLGSTFFGDGTGDLTIQENGVTINKVTKCPAFSAFMSSVTTVTSGVETTVPLDRTEFNLENCFNTTNYRFTPNVAGYYQFNMRLRVSTSGTITNVWQTLSLNGGTKFRGGETDVSSSRATQYCSSHIMYLNGTTDYVTYSGYIGGSGTVRFDQANPGDNNYTCSLSGFLVRAA